MTEKPVRAVARLKAKPGNENELRTFLASMLEPVRKEEGCISYELFENRTDPTDFTFVEEWSSDKTWDTHLEGLQSILPELMKLLAEPPDIRTYSTVE